MKLLSDNMAQNLLKDLSLGVQILFYHHWSNWIKTINQTKINLNQIEQSNAGKKLPEICLKDIVDSTVEGASVAKYYTNHNCLNDGIRQLLVDAIVNFYYSRKLDLSTSVCADLTKQIILTFNGEEAVCIISGFP